MSIVCEAGGRLKGVQIAKPIVYGNVAWFIGGSGAKDGHTHQWHVYLKAVDNEDMSVYVKRVHFKLHESYPDPIRVCHAPPYEVTETGWGEFELSIKIFFQDSNERPVTIYHSLTLFDREKNGELKTLPDENSPVSSEFFDELIFNDPTVKMHALLSHPKFCAAGTSQQGIDYEEQKARHLKKILELKTKVRTEIMGLRSRLQGNKEMIAILKSQLKPK